MRASHSTAKKATTDAGSIVTNLNSSADTGTLVEAITSLATEVAELEERVEDQQATIDELEEQLRAEQETRGKADADTRQRLHNVETAVQDLEATVSGDANPTLEAGQTTTQHPTVEPQTDLESMTTMPERVLEDQTANVRRAIFVASDVEDYTTGCPAGRVIRSSELRRVLQAGTDCNGHTQTVARVMDLLDRTGGDGTTVVERRGERRLVFDQDLVDRLSALTSQSHGGDRDTVEAT